MDIGHADGRVRKWLATRAGDDPLHLRTGLQHELQPRRTAAAFQDSFPATAVAGEHGFDVDLADVRCVEPEGAVSRADRARGVLELALAAIVHRPREDENLHSRQGRAPRGW